MHSVVFEALDRHVFALPHLQPYQRRMASDDDDENNESVAGWTGVLSIDPTRP